MKTYPKKSAENSHLPHPHKFANRSKRRWHKARMQGKLGEQLDRKYTNTFTRNDRLDAIASMKGL